MIKCVQVLLTFPLGAEFRDNVNLILYTKLVRFIKDLVCFNSQTKCKECEYCLQCRYYSIFGENFTGYPGILIENDLFEKKSYSKGEQKIWNFYFVGNTSVYLKYIEVFMDSLNQKLAGNFFYMNSISEKNIDIKYPIPGSAYKIQFPIESVNFADSYNRMVAYYNQNYGCNYKIIENEICLTNSKKIVLPDLYLGTRKIRIKGYVGDVLIPDDIDRELLSIGIGRYNFIGGGKVAIKN